LIFFSGRWKAQDAQGKLIFFPSQAIETWQCPTYPPVVNDCVTNDLPDIAGLAAVIPRLLALPNGFLTPDFITKAKTLLSRLPPIPTAVKAGKTVFVAGEKLPADTSNSENAELYTAHPYRIALRDSNAKNAAIASYGIRKFPCNTGWCQDIMDAALLGLTSEAMTQVVDRANTKPATGYRFPGFMPHFQDFEPSSDHLSNMNNALQWMLLQGDDVTNDIVLFPTWPCKDWNVDFKLRGPLNTVVQGKYVNGKISSYSVMPASRTNNVKFAACVSQ